MNIVEFIKTQLKHKELRYVISGVASVVIEYISFVILIIFTPLLVANSISFIIGIASGFVFHKLWSFAGNQKLQTHYQIVSYCVVATFNFIATNLIISFLVKGMDSGPLLAKFITMSVVAIWTYIIFAVFIFRKSSTDDQ